MHAPRISQIQVRPQEPAERQKKGEEEKADSLWDAPRISERASMRECDASPTGRRLQQERASRADPDRSIMAAL